MKLSEIIYSSECEMRYDFDDIEIKDITLSEHEIGDGTLLVLPNSQKIPRLSKMPAAILTSSDAKIPYDVPTVRAKNVRRLMAFACSRFYSPDYSKLKIIGITGTNGKTSTATLIKEILEGSGVACGFIGTGKIAIGEKILSNKYYSMTTPDPPMLYKILKEMEVCGCKNVVMEVSSHALALEKVAPIQFDYAVFTNLSSEHSDFHGDLEKYYGAKCRLFKQCKTAVFNIDDTHARRLASAYSGRKITAGVIWKGDVWVSDYENRGLDGVSYIYHGKNFSTPINLNLPGSHSVYNSMLALAVSIDTGVKPCEAKSQLKSVEQIEGRFEIIKEKITVIIDYAHTDAAFLSVMRTLAEMKTKRQKLTVVFGCGGERDREKRPRMAAIAEKYADRIIVTSDNARGEDPKDIISDIIRGFSSCVYEVCENRIDAIRRAIITANPSDIVAVIGKGCEKYNIDKDGYHDFDEKSIIRTALDERGDAK